jgi:hypothetical protein
MRQVFMDEEPRSVEAGNPGAGQRQNQSLVTPAENQPALSLTLSPRKGNSSWTDDVFV